ncbi:Carboxypeptidase regulatory-like domain-containing protein [Terriglobus roseus]|uniref:Carboxypeptidase regulatory-like domain-containing protein n=2 Tax=Terriglobus roseus TaxID=392734 RepID=A0A1H4SEW9_9BACT|nr:Carboxypeptidase regulatory-like domain-containing protein [Terriglobus roseus]
MVKPLKRIGRCSLQIMLAILTLLTTHDALAQAVNGTLLGTITDQSKAVVPGATITITEVKSGAVKTTKTNESGFFDFEALQPGTYRVSATQTGFKEAQVENVAVVVNSTARIDLSMALGSMQESVTISAAPEVLKTDRADVAVDITSQQAEDLPLTTNRNVQGLVALAPGATKPRLVHSNFFNAQASLSTEVNGQSRLANNTEIEGVDDNERSGLLQVLIPPSEAIESVNVSTANYQAEFGRVGGAITDIILKSGTNAVHGQVYEFNRISALAAKTRFQTTDRAPSVYNYTGGNVGGPILKNKLFLFGDYLHIADHQGQFNTTTVPTAAFRVGDLSAGGTNIYDPATGDATGKGRAQFSYQGRPNVIDPTRISPITQRILALIPLPNVNGNSLTNNYSKNTHFTRTSNSFDVKADANLREGDHVSYRYSWQKVDQYQEALFGAAGGPGQGANNAAGTQTAYNTALNYTHVFSPKLLAEVRIGLNHYRNTARQVDYGTTASSDIGIPGVNLDANTSGLTGINLGGGLPGTIVGSGASYPWDRGETNVDLVNNWSRVLGNHSIKFGGEFRRVRDDLLQGQSFGQRGVFNFTDGTTALNGGPKTGIANYMASFLLDVPNSAGRDVAVKDATWRESQVFAYAQDAWQASSKLTANFGVRWELYKPPTARHNGDYSNYDPTTNSLIIAGIGNNPADLGMVTRYSYFAPRVGLAYRFDTQTVVRAGYGISYQSWPDNLNSYATNFPLKQNNSFNALNSFSQALQNNGARASMAAGFPAPLLATIPANGVITNAPLQSYFVVPLKWKAPYVQSWNLAVQRALPGGFALDVAYVGNVGIGQAQNYNLNAGFVAGAGAAGQPQFSTFGRTQSTTTFRQAGSNYNSLQVKLEHRFASSLSATAAYTYQKGMGYTTSNSTGVGGTNFYLDFQRNYTVLGNNRTHTLVQSFIYQLPFGKGKKWANHGFASLIAGGWQTTGVMSIESGTPFSVTASATILNAPGNTQVANINGKFTKRGGIGAGTTWFDTSVFSQPTTAAYGNTGQNAFIGPGFFNLDASVFRTFALTERANLELRAEGFSITNTPQYGNPSSNVNNSDFGQINGSSGGASGNRSVELAGKIRF